MGSVDSQHFDGRIPEVPARYVEEMRLSMPDEIFRQEFLADPQVAHNHTVVETDGPLLRCSSRMKMGTPGGEVMGGIDTIDYYPDFMFSNNGDGTFSETARALGLDNPGRGRSASMVDFDGDGMMWLPNPDVPATSGTLINHGTMVGDDTFTDHILVNTGGLLQNSGTLPANVFDGGGTFEDIASTCLVAGEIIPIDATALLLAGSQSYSWMIPVILSVLGIGLFIFRKSENS